MSIYYSDSPTATENIAAALALQLKGGEIIAFKGDLGQGKTCFTRGLAKGLGFSGEVTSPTFALMNEYLGGRLNLYHFDMYRISTWEDLYSSGYFEYVEQGGVVAVEWSENIESALNGKVITVTIKATGETTREIIIEGADGIENFSS